jgi:hypothetical protein
MKKAHIFCRLLLLGVIFLFLLVLAGCLVGGGGEDVVPSYDYTTTVTSVASQDVNASSGGVVEVTASTSPLKGLKLTIPSGALPTNTTVTIGQANNPPELPSGLNYIGAPINLGPDILFNSPLTIEIPYHDEHLSDAGISDDTALELYSYDKSTREWEEVTIISIDTANNKITAQITHFSYLAITGRNGTPPEDLGTPQPGDLLYKTGSIFGETPAIGWRPGHVGIYTGEKTYPGIGLASDDVKEYGRYNVVEALWGGVQYSYYDIPNVKETYQSSLIGFNRSDIYMGAREPANVTLTAQQRTDIVAYAEDQVGKHYAWAQTAGVLFGMLSGLLVKGPSFNCVGLAEAAYEAVGVDLVTWWQEETGVGLALAALTPAEQYNATKPAGGINPLPKIEWATLTPNSGTECTLVLAQISVSHTYGLSYIDSVIYVTDDGYTNPELYINDEGLQGDISSGDGIYSTEADAGGDASMGQAGLNFTVTDKLGKTATIRLLYTFTGTCRQSAKTSEVKREMLPRFFY